MNLSPTPTIPYYYQPLGDVQQIDTFYQNLRIRSFIDNFRSTYQRNLYIPHHDTLGIRMYNMAYNKCVRLTVRIGNIPNVNTFTSDQLRNIFVSHFTNEDHDSYYLGIAMNSAASGVPYRSANITIVKEADDAFRLMNRLVTLVQSGSIGTLHGHQNLCFLGIGSQPTLMAVEIALDEARRFLQPATPPQQPQPALTFEALWPPIIDVSNPHAAAIHVENSYLARKRNEFDSKVDALRKLFERSKEEHSQDMFDYDYIKWSTADEFLLGGGNEAKVYLGLFRGKSAPEDSLSVPVAVKVAASGISYMENAKERDYSLQQAGLSIVKYFGADSFKEGRVRLNILVQEAGICSLLDITQSGTLNEEERFRIVLAMVTAIAELHQSNPSILHRDVHPRNFIVMRDGTVRLTDLGLAVRIGNSRRQSVTVRGLPTRGQPHEVLITYGAQPETEEDPDAEAFMRIVASKSGDIFMLGCSIAIVYGEIPFRSDDAIRDREVPRLSAELEAEKPWLVHLVRRMMSHDKDQRPTIEEVLKHPFILATPNYYSFLLGKLFDRLHRVIVADFLMERGQVTQGPRDDEEFRALEVSLRSIETSIVNAGTPWYLRMPDKVLRAHRPEFQYDPMYPPVRFVRNGFTEPREFPLPRVASLVYWLRNMLIHFGNDAALVQNIVSAKPGGEAYVYPGLFFVSHPSVEWLFTKHWEEGCNIVRGYEQQKQQERDNFEKAMDVLQRNIMNTRIWIGI